MKLRNILQSPLVKGEKTTLRDNFKKVISTVVLSLAFLPILPLGVKAESVWEFQLKMTMRRARVQLAAQAAMSEEAASLKRNLTYDETYRLYGKLPTLLKQKYGISPIDTEYLLYEEYSSDVYNNPNDSLNCILISLPFALLIEKPDEVTRDCFADHLKFFRVDDIAEEYSESPKVKELNNTPRKLLTTPPYDKYLITELGYQLSNSCRTNAIAAYAEIYKGIVNTEKHVDNYSYFQNNIKESCEEFYLGKTLPQ